MAEKKCASLGKEKEFILECIRLYRELPTLWNVKSKVYYDRAKKDMAYKILLRKYKQWYPKATREDVKKKFNTLRTNYRKELRKHMESVKSDTAPVYEPSLWYYNELCFLDIQPTTVDASDPTVSSMDLALIHSEVDEELSTESQASTSSVQHDSSLGDVSFRTVTQSAVDKNALDKSLTSYPYENHNEKYDEYFHWAMACAADLRKMERTQQVYAKKAIAEIVMEGQLGLLHRYSVGGNESQTSGHYNNSSGQFNSKPSQSYIPCDVEQSECLETKPFLQNPLQDVDKED